MMETERTPCTRAGKGHSHSLQDPTPTLWSHRQRPPCAVRVLCPLYASQLPAAPRLLQSKAPQAWRSPHNHRYCSELTCLRDSLLVSGGPVLLDPCLGLAALRRPSQEGSALIHTTPLSMYPEAHSICARVDMDTLSTVEQAQVVAKPGSEEDITRGVAAGRFGKWGQ